MPLQDHFHSPLSLMRNWHGFDNGWMSSVTEAISELLPPNYFAQPNEQFGIEIDVGGFDTSNGVNGAHHPSSWSAPPANLTGRSSSRNALVLCHTLIVGC